MPLPDAPAVIVTKAALLVAVHAQPDPAVTETLPLPPAAAKLVLAADAVTVHDGFVGVELLPELSFEHAPARRHASAATQNCESNRLTTRLA